MAKLQSLLLVVTTALGCANPLAAQIRSVTAPKLDCPADDVEVMPDVDNDSSWIASCDMLMVYVDCDAGQTCEVRPAKEAPRSLGLDPLSGPGS